MAEPEELILEGAHVATRIARDVWRRYAPAAEGVALAQVRVRLEAFLTALFQCDVAVAPMPPPAPLSWLGRLAHGRPRRDPPAICGTDGRRVFLPATLPRSIAGHDALTHYRLLAVEQAARLVRGTAGVAVQIDDAETRDWFLLAEAAAVDRWIAVEVPGLVPALAAARRDALAEISDGPAALDGSIAGRVRAFLAGDPVVPPPGAVHDVPEGCWHWARDPRTGDARRYRGVRLPSYWGRVVPVSEPLAPATRFTDDAAPPMPARPRVASMRRRPRERPAADDEDDGQAGTWVIRADEPQESVEDPFGLQRPADHDDAADPEGLGDSLSELPEARIVSTPAPPREVLRADEPIERVERPPVPPAGRCGVVYPEWDHRLRAYRAHGAIVRERTVALGDAAWVDAANARHARLARRVRVRFERLRPRPVTLNRQIDGDEPDIAAWVDTCADIRAGGTVDGRVYVQRRPSRRELAVALLTDVSASTDAWVSGDRRIVDVEKEALLVVCEALDALGDRYAIFAFAGEGADDVSVLPLKGFHERRDGSVGRRIAGLDADGYTRMGAAIRHVTAALGGQPTSRRLLLVLSDGKPNDIDVYEGQYGVEDTGQAVAEARRQGITVFCLTVDREAPRYAGRVFGPAGFAVLRRTEQLPTVLIEVLQQLVRR